MESFFEGDDDHIPVTACGSYGTPMTLDVEIPETAQYLCLRRMSDQKNGRQRARVYVDGVPMKYDWYFADRNPHKRWLEDEYIIPASYIDGKKHVQIRVEPISEGWNHFGYTVFGCK